MFTLLAQIQEKSLQGQLEGLGKIGGVGVTPCQQIPLFVDIMSKIIGILTVSAALWFVIQFILGAFRWITSGGDAKAVEGARMQIIHAIIGMVIVFGALILLSVLGTIMGTDLLNLETIIKGLTPGGGSACGSGGAPAPGVDR